MRDRYANLREGLVGAWCPSIRGSGFTLPDLSGYGNHGTLTNMASDDWVSGQYGRALDFDGSNDRVRLPDNYLRTAQSGCISAWVKFNGAGTNQNPIVSLGGNANLTVFAFRRFDTAGVFQNAIELRIFSSPDIDIYSTDKIDNGIWSHALVQSDGTKYGMFVNGKKQTIVVAAGSDSGDWIGDMTGTTGSTVCDIGAQFAAGALFSSMNGQTDDIRIYNRALSESEIRILASRPGIGLVPQRRVVYDAPKTRRRNHALIGNMF